jgi:hypothetical protein
MVQLEIDRDSFEDTVEEHGAVDIRGFVNWDHAYRVVSDLEYQIRRKRECVVGAQSEKSLQFLTQPDWPILDDQLVPAYVPGDGQTAGLLSGSNGSSSIGREQELECQIGWSRVSVSDRPTTNKPAIILRQSPPARDAYDKEQRHRRQPSPTSAFRLQRRGGHIILHNEKPADDLTGGS